MLSKHLKKLNKDKLKLVKMLAKKQTYLQNYTKSPQVYTEKEAGGVGCWVGILKSDFTITKSNWYGFKTKFGSQVMR